MVMIYRPLSVWSSPVKGGVSRRRLWDDLHQSGLVTGGPSSRFEVTESLQCPVEALQFHDMWFRKIVFFAPLSGMVIPQHLRSVEGWNHQPDERITRSNVPKLFQQIQLTLLTGVKVQVQI